MSWVKIDDRFSEHPKVLKAGPLGMAMQMAALCYCNRNLTDGFVPRQAAAKLLDLSGIGMRLWNNEMFGGGEDATWGLVVEDLVAAGIWDEADGGWRIHDYLDYQPSKAAILTERDKTKQRVSRWRERNGAGNGVSNTAPVPVPVPVKKESESKQAALASPPPAAKPNGSLKEPRGARLDIEALPDDWRSWCAEKRPDLNPDTTWLRFGNYFRSKAGKDARKLNWYMAWQNWVTTERPPPTGLPTLTGPKPDEYYEKLGRKP